MIKTCHRLLLPFSIGLLFLCSSFVSLNPNENAGIADEGIFSCVINGKPYVVKGFSALMRKVTCGHKELSLSNDFFTSFFVINPSAKDYELNIGPKRGDAIVKYTNPDNFNMYVPETGHVTLQILDESAKTLSGEFEMELIPKDQPGKKIKVTKGRFINVPIIYR